MQSFGEAYTKTKVEGVFGVGEWEGVVGEEFWEGFNLHMVCAGL